MPDKRLRQLAFEEDPEARIVLDADGALAMTNRKARALFDISPKSVKDLEIFARPAGLASLVQQACLERRALTLSGVERRLPEGERQCFDVVVAPLLDEAHTPLGASLTFTDVTRYARFSEELQRSRGEIHAVNDDLQSSNESLKTANEKLQSANEALEVASEELQSANELLGTMNEQLQAVNEEVRQRAEEMHRLNAFLESVLAGMPSAAVVLNASLEVLIWNRLAEDLWRLRADEAQGRSLAELGIGLPLGELRELVRPCLTGERDRAQAFLNGVRILCTPLVLDDRRRDGVILLMEKG